MKQYEEDKKYKEDIIINKKYFNINLPNLKKLNGCNIISSKIPEAPGVYIISKKIKTSIGFSLIPMYVGQSVNIRSRMSEHRNGYIDIGASMIEYGYISWLIVEDPLERTVIEAAYISALKPPLNRRK